MAKNSGNSLRARFSIVAYFPLLDLFEHHSSNRVIENPAVRIHAVMVERGKWYEYVVFDWDFWLGCILIGISMGER